MTAPVDYIRPHIEKFADEPCTVHLPELYLNYVELGFSYFLTLFEESYPELFELIVDVEDIKLKARLVTCFNHFYGAMDAANVLDLIISREIDYFENNGYGKSICTWHSYRHGTNITPERIDSQIPCYVDMLETTIGTANPKSKNELMLFKVKSPDGENEKEEYIFINLFLTSKTGLPADYFKKVSKIMYGLWNIYIDTVEWPVDQILVPGEFFTDLNELVGSEIAGKFLTTPVNTGKPAN